MKRNIKLILFMLVASVALVACGGADEGATGEDANQDATDEVVEEGEAVRSGEEIYKSACASCHANDLTGASGPDLTVTEYSVEEIADISENGHGTMPSGLASSEEAEIVAEWILDR